MNSKGKEQSAQKKVASLDIMNKHSEKQFQVFNEKNQPEKG